MEKCNETIDNVIDILNSKDDEYEEDLKRGLEKGWDIHPGFKRIIENNFHLHKDIIRELRDCKHTLRGGRKKTRKYQRRSKIE